MRVGQRNASYLQRRRLLRLYKISFIVALLISLIQIYLSEILVLHQVVQHLSQRRKSLLKLFNIAIQHSIDYFFEIIQHYLQRFTILFLENDLCLSVAHLLLPIDFMEIEAFTVGAVVAFEEVGAVFGGPKGDLQWPIGKVVSIE